MKNSVKIALTLLISLLISGGFTFLAFSNLFSLIETGVYLPNLKKQAETEAGRFRDKIAEYHEVSLSRYGEIVKRDYIWRAFRANQSIDDIEMRSNELSRLLQEFPKLKVVRLVGPEGRKLNFSTQDTDTDQGQSNLYRITYKNLDKIPGELSGDILITRAGEAPKVIYDPVSRLMIYSFPVVDPENVFRGSALFYVLVSDLENNLGQISNITFRDIVVIHTSGIIIDVSGKIALIKTEDINTIQKTVTGTWNSNIVTVSSEVIRFEKTNEKAFLFSLPEKQSGFVGVLYSSSRFEMQLTDKIVILLIFYSTVFLVVLLVLNIRQDPLMLISARMKKFQTEFLNEFVDKKDEIDLNSWQHRLDLRRDEVKRSIKKGLKKLDPGKETEIDAYIINSWNEVVSVIKSKIEQPPKEQTDLARIEALLRKILAEGHIVVAQRPAAPGLPQSYQVVDESILDEPLSGKKAPVEEAEVVDDADSVEELDEIEEIETIGEAETVGEANGIEELDTIEEMETIEESDELIGDVEAAEEIEAIEEVDTAELEMLAEAEEPAGEGDVLFREALKHDEENIEELAFVDECSDQVIIEKKDAVPEGKIQNLEVFPEIMPLPPLPFEKLPELPLIEEEDKRRKEAERVFAEILQGIEKQRVEVLSIEDVLRVLDEKGKNVIMEDGVFRIRKDLYNKTAGDGKSFKGGLRARAESFLKTPVVEEEPVVSGIDQLLGSKGVVLDTIIKKEQTGQEDTIFNSIAKRIPLTGKGLDLDRYMRAFGKTLSDKTKITAFGDILKKSKAINAVLFMEEKQLSVSISIGLTSKSAAMFQFGADEPFFTEYIAQKKIVFIKEGFSKLQLFTECFSPDDLRFIDSGIFIPAFSEQKPAYIFLGFSATVGYGISDLMQKIEVFLP
ncbi:MAG: hypothetical protein JW904_12395 [Spirochaetales bacterium]|nr:hypothetical protein [Spirochaetales bacterium]